MARAASATGGCAATTPSQPGNVVQGARTALDGVRKRGHDARDRLRRDARGGRAARRARRCARGFAARRSALRRRLARATSTRSTTPPASVAGDPRCGALRAVADGARRVGGQALPRRLDRRAEHAVGVGHADARGQRRSPAPTTSSGRATSTTWPRRRRRPATTRRRDRLLDYLWRVQKPDGSWWQNTRVDGTEYWTSLQLDEIALPVVLAWWLGRTGAADWAHVERAADFIVANGPADRAGALGEPGAAGRRTRSRPRSPALICAADIAREQRRPRRARRATRRPPTTGRRRSRRWTATTNGPVLARAVLPARDQGRQSPDDGTTYDLGDNLPAAGRPARDRRQLVPRARAVRRQARGTTRRCSTRSPSATRSSRVDTPSGRIWHRFTFDGYGETADGGDWTSSTTAARQTLGRAVAAADRRARRVRAARRPRRRRRTCGRSPTPPTTA